MDFINEYVMEAEMEMENLHVWDRLQAIGFFDVCYDMWKGNEKAICVVNWKNANIGTVETTRLGEETRHEWEKIQDMRLKVNTKLGENTRHDVGMPKMRY